MSKKPDRFHNPFQGLKLVVEPQPASKAPPPPRLTKRPDAADDDALFRAAMMGVRALDQEPGRAPPPPPPEAAPFTDDEAEAYAQLAELVAGGGSFDLADSDEYIEGWAQGVDHGLVATLRRGQYAVQAHVDLHGMTKDEAKEAVERFLATSRKKGLRCVLLVHGRGLNSKDHIPVLKERLRVWLARGRMARSVLAFATALSTDGGAGALYVLLRR